MKGQQLKICPDCKQTASLDATECAGCGHAFRTKFTSKQPIWKRVPLGAWVALGVGAVLLAVTWANPAANRPPVSDTPSENRLVGTWRTQLGPDPEDYGEMMFGSDGSYRGRSNVIFSEAITLFDLEGHYKVTSNGKLHLYDLKPTRDGLFISPEWLEDMTFVNEDQLMIGPTRQSLMYKRIR